MILNWKHLFARKDLETLLAEMAGEHQLRRVLGPVSLTSLGIGCIIGAGIFVLTGMAAADDGGPAIVLSFAVAAVGCALAALCYAEFAAMVPVAGSVYAYAYTTLGELFAWIIGWDLMLEYSMGCATVASSWSGYFNEFLDVLGLPRVSAVLCSDPFTPIEGVAARPLFNLPSVLIMILVTSVLVVGIRESARANATLVLIKVAVVLFIIAVGIAYVDPGNWTAVPVTERVLPQERVLAGMVKEYLTEDAQDLPGTEPFELRRQQLEKRLAASYRLRWVEQENQRLLDAGRIKPEEAESRSREVFERVKSQLPTTTADQEIIDRLLPKVEAEGHKRAVSSWGLLGLLGLDKWLVPIDDATRSPFAPYGLSGIMLGAAIVFFAFIGFDSISTHAEEARNPRRDVPIGILVSLIVCTILYMAVAAIITGMVRYPDIDARAPIAVAFAQKAAESAQPSHARGDGPHRGRRFGGHDKCAARAVPEPSARVHGHGPRWLAATGIRARASPLEDAARRDHRHGRRHLCGGGLDAYPQARGDGQHWHSLGIRDCVRCRDDHSGPAAGRSPTFSLSSSVRGGTMRHRSQSDTDAVPSRGYMAEARGLAANRLCRLFLLQSFPQPSGTTPASRVDHAGTRW